MEEYKSDKEGDIFDHKKDSSFSEPDEEIHVISDAENTILNKNPS